VEDKLSELIDILQRLLQAQRPIPNQIDSELHEAMERFERDLPLTTRHVARLLDISERTVKRTIPGVARSKPGGTVWYSRGEVEALWQVQAGGGGGRRDTGSPRRRGGRSRSSIAASAVGSSTSNLLAISESASHSVDAVEKRLAAMHRSRRATLPAAGCSRYAHVRPSRRRNDHLE